MFSRDEVAVCNVDKFTLGFFFKNTNAFAVKEFFHLKNIRSDNLLFLAVSFSLVSVYDIYRNNGLHFRYHL